MKFPLLRLASEGSIGLRWVDWLRDQGEPLPLVTGPVFSTFALLLLELVAERGVALGYLHIVDQLFLDRRIVRLSDRSVKPALGFYAVFRETESIPIAIIFEFFRTGITAPTTTYGALALPP